MIAVTKERVLRLILPAVAAALMAPLPQAAAAQAREAADRGRAELRGEIADRVDGDLKPFYAARDYRPLWLNDFGRPSGAASMLMHQLNTAEFDGINPKKLKVSQLARRVDRARRGDPEDIARAEVELSTAFAAYVRAMRAADHVEMIYESEALAPVVPTARSALEAAARADSLEHYIAEMRWMHPLYAPLRDAMEDPRFSQDQRRQIWANLARLRAIPANPRGRHILVDTASARLWMYENGEPVDSMKVVVGKPGLQTPMMAGFVRYAIVNPYWNVPPDLVKNTIAANVLDRGVGYLKAGGYQVLADSSPDAPLLDPETVDWQAVHAGRDMVHVRQLPGGDNFMGKVKFMFPNAQGIYLHDTPDRQLLKLDDRHLSSGCIRLEDAAKMHRWLMGKPLPRDVDDPETVVRLPEWVPIYVTYLTAMPEGDRQVAFRADPYARDTFRDGGSERGRTALARVDRP